MSEIDLGDEVRDLITGFEGIVVARLETLFWINKAEVQQRGLDCNERPFESVWLPLAQLERKKKSICFENDECRVTEEELRQTSSTESR